MEQLLLFLQHRHATSGSDNADVRQRRQSVVDQRRKMLDDGAKGGRQARLAELDQYREMLYEDLNNGVLQGAGLILQVGRKKGGSWQRLMYHHNPSWQECPTTWRSWLATSR